MVFVQLDKHLRRGLEVFYNEVKELVENEVKKGSSSGIIADRLVENFGIIKDSQAISLFIQKENLSV